MIGGCVVTVSGDGKFRTARSRSKEGALTDAQRARRYRQNRKMAALVDVNKPPAGWVPAFEGQRPPFGPGNTVSRKHGGHSPDVVNPLAERIAEHIVLVPGNEYLREPRNAIAVENWAHAHARVLLMRAYVNEQGLEEALAEVTEVEETEERPSPGVLRRYSRAKSVVSTWNALEKAERQESHLAIQLGLTPLSRVKLGKAAQSPAADLALIWAAEDDGEAV